MKRLEHYAPGIAGGAVGLAVLVAAEPEGWWWVFWLYWAGAICLVVAIFIRGLMR